MDRFNSFSLRIWELAFTRIRDRFKVGEFDLKYTIQYNTQQIECNFFKAIGGTARA